MILLSKQDNRATRPCSFHCAAANFQNLVIFLDKLPERPNVLSSRPANFHDES